MIGTFSPKNVLQNLVIKGKREGPKKEMFTSPVIVIRTSLIYVVDRNSTESFLSGTLERESKVLREISQSE